MTGMIGHSETAKVPADRQAFGDYLLLERIGEGPVGATFLALDRRDGQRVILRQDVGGAGDAAALRREAKLLGGLRHDNVVRLLESGERDGRAYSVLAQEDGVSLDRLPAAWRSSMGQRSLIELLKPLLTALDAVHRAGFLHGDISPRNIVLRRDGTPLLIDFGAAVELDPSQGGEAQEDGPPPAATPGFTAPERGDPARQGPGSDLFALAAVIYWLIAGRPPVAPASVPPDRTDSLSELAGGDRRFSSSFLLAIDAVLAPEIGDRPASAGDWHAALLKAEPPERADAPDLAQLAGALREEAEIDLPSADEVPPTALLNPEERYHAARPPMLRSDRASAALSTRKQRGSGAGMALAAVLILLAAGGAAAGWWGWTWYRDASKQDWIVDAAGGGDTTTVGEAIARAPDGATISVRAGVYAESLALERPVHLQGPTEDGGEAVISPPGGRCLLLNARSGTLRGLAFEGGSGTSTGSDACLEVGSGAMEITGIRIGPWAGNGVLIRDGAAPLFRDNDFLDIDGSAVIVDEGAGGVIEENRIQKTGKSAIKARAGADPTIRGNEILEAGQAGLLIEQGARGHYSGNRIAKSASSGIEVRGGASPRVSDNTIEDAGQAGLFIHEGARGAITDNKILRSKLSGIVVTGGAAPLVSGNEVSDGEQHGLLVIGGAGGQFTGNKIRGNKGHAIVLGTGQEAKLEQNELEDNRKPQLRRISP